MSATTLTAKILHTSVAKLTAIAEVAKMLASLCKETTANAHAQTDNDKVTHTMSQAESMLAQSRDMGIVGHAYGQPDTFAQHHGQGYGALPGQVGCVNNITGCRAGAWRTDAYGTDTLVTAVGLYQCNDFLTQCRHELVDIWILRGVERFFCQYVTPNINYRISGTAVADIYTNYP